MVVNSFIKFQQSESMDAFRKKYGQLSSKYFHAKISLFTVYLDFFLNYLKNFMTFRLQNKTLFYSSHFLPQQLYMHVHFFTKFLYETNTNYLSRYFQRRLRLSLHEITMVQRLLNQISNYCDRSRNSLPPPSPPSGVG